MFQLIHNTMYFNLKGNFGRKMFDKYAKEVEICRNNRNKSTCKEKNINCMGSPGICSVKHTSKQKDFLFRFCRCL